MARKISKAEQSKLKIIEATIQVAATSVGKSFSYQDIGDLSGLSRQLIKHYFPQKSGLWHDAAILVREKFIVVATKGLAEETDPVEQLRKYVLQTMTWSRKCEKDFLFWLQFIHKASADKDLEVLYQKMEQVGQDRIQGIILRGCASKAFKVKPEKIIEKVIMMQSLIAGTLIFLKMNPTVDDKKMRQAVAETCLGFFVSSDS